MFNFSDINNMDWKGVNVGIEGSNIGEELLLNHMILMIRYLFIETLKITPPHAPRNIKVFRK